MGAQSRMRSFTLPTSGKDDRHSSRSFNGTVMSMVFSSFPQAKNREINVFLQSPENAEQKLRLLGIRNPMAKQMLHLSPKKGRKINLGKYRSGRLTSACRRNCGMGRLKTYFQACEEDTSWEEASQIYQG